MKINQYWKRYLALLSITIQ